MRLGIFRSNRRERDGVRGLPESRNNRTMVDLVLMLDGVPSNELLDRLGLR